MSGSLPEAICAVIFCLYASFSIVTTLIFTSGCAASNSLARWAHSFFAGWVVVMFHHSIVFFPEPLSSSEEPHALSPAAPRPVAADAARNPRREKLEVEPNGRIAHLPE